MTRLQMVRSLDVAIDASFRRSASSPEEQSFRQRCREAQKQLRAAHNNERSDRRLRRAFYELVAIMASIERHA